MFNLISGNDAARLADAFGERLRTRAPGNPLTPVLVLVPQAGLRRWLEVHLAERLGVIANLRFLPPAQFVWELLRADEPQLAHASPFDPEALRWHVFALLDTTLDAVALTPLRDYLGDRADPLRRYALSGELARMYERLQGYRRKRLLRWERGEEHGGWQGELWRRVLRRAGGASRAARLQAWLDRYDAERAPAPPGLPQRASAFACTNVSPDVLRVLGVAARHCEIDFLMPAPTREYYGDTPHGRRAVRERMHGPDDANPLIVSLGGAAAEFVNLLYEYRCVQPDSEIELFDEAIPRVSLLGRIRDDMLAHRAPDATQYAAVPDDSLQFHACHTELREVQTLHDALLALFARDPSLQPRNVAVMMPDVATYRASIEAVFGGVDPRDPRFIPYAVGDVPVGATHPALHLFLRLLDAPGSRWELSELLDVLAVPGVMRRCDLGRDDLAQLARTLHAAGVRWGENEHARAGRGDYREFSFAFGIDRLLAGFALGDGGPELVGKVAPQPGLEGAALAPLDALMRVLDAWRRLRELPKHPRAARDWQAELNRLFDQLYEDDRDDADERRARALVREALAQLADATEAAHIDALPWHDVRAFLRERLTAADPRQHLFGGGVTFCGMVPLRVVPFRAICLLGMNDEAFPRRDPGVLDPLLADRRADRREPGDRSVREDDRLLFLQLIAAARDTLYISWLGRDAHSNKPTAPSSVVAELIDLVRGRYLPASGDGSKARDECLPRIEPLHPFDAKLFDAAAPVSFRGEWLPAAQRERGTRTLPPFFAGARAQAKRGGDAATLDLATLHRFFDHPARAWLLDGLHLHVPREQHEDLDREPLQPDQPLLRYRLAAALLTRDADAARDIETLLRARGELPPGELAQAAIAIARERADALRAAIAEFTRGEAVLPDASCTLTLADGTLLTGTVRDRYPAGLLRAAPGTLDGKRAMRAWLDALFAAANESAGACRLIALGEKNAVKVCDLLVPDAAAARDKLAELVAAYRRGLREPLPLFPQTSWACLKRTRQKGAATFDEFVRLFADTFEKADDDNAFGGPSEFGDAAVRLAWRDIVLPGARAGELFDTATALFPPLVEVKQKKGRKA